MFSVNGNNHVHNFRCSSFVVVVVFVTAAAKESEQNSTK